MNKEQEIKGILFKRGFRKTIKSNVWQKDSWTVRLYGDDIEIFDDIEKSGKYLLDSIDRVNIQLALDELDIE